LNKSRILKLALVIEATVLLSAASALSRNYQDSWILEGLEIPFALFMVTYSIYFFTENKITWIITFAIICRSVLLLLPNLKYEWFQGVAIDSHRHYRLTQDIYNEGYVPSGNLYSDTPLMHLSFAIYSMITNVSVLHSFKYFSVSYWLIYPLMIYLVMKKSGLTENPSLSKYALFISSLPVKSEVGSYIVIGTLFGPLLSFLILLQFIKMSQQNSRLDWIIAIIYSIALVATHTYSSIMLMMVLLAIYAIILSPQGRRIFNFKKISYVPFMTIVLINCAWLSLKATNLLEMIIETEIPYMERLLGYEAVAGVAIPPRLFELGFTEALKVAIIFHGGDMLLMFLTLIGIVIAAKNFHTRSKSTFIFLSLYVTSLWLFLAVGLLVFNFGEQWYDRILRMTSTVSPIFASIPFFHMKKGIRNTKLAIFLIGLVILAPIQHYRCQPLVPPASAYSKDLPTDEPVVYINIVNSAYQIHMIKHSETYFPQGKLIACDRVTRDQIFGLTNRTFPYSHLAWYYPLEMGATERRYDYFLIHLPGKSGVLLEKAEARTKSLIYDAMTHSNILYTNAESYILTNPLMI